LPNATPDTVLIEQACDTLALTAILVVALVAAAAAPEADTSNAAT
jgi:hypothetical protein